MKLNSHIIFLIVIVGIITAGVVGATLLNNGSMKQVDFDGIKVDVPSDADFVKTNDGYADAKYGITIHPFKNNASATNYLKSVTGASVIALKNQPPQSVAFVQGDDTNVLVTNGAEAIAIGAKDQSLVSDMSNSVVFSNHQKSVKPKVSIPGIVAPPHLEMDNDFYLIKDLMIQVNTAEFNLAIFEANITPVINEYNLAVDQGTIDEYTADEFVQDTASEGAVANNENTSLLDNQEVSSIVSSIGSDDSSAGSAAGGDVEQSNDASIPSISSDSVSSPSGDGGIIASGDDSSTASQDKLTPDEIKELVQQALPTGYTITKVKDEGDYYLISIKDTTGHVEKLKFDAYTAQEIKDPEI
ncbi:hypothetical protein [Methanobrevibacter sp.]|uniref:hypothetical protein n=1 Tax=Methanobrevibacter sp. TaxID=66852 RepID=UPI0038906AB9